MNLKNIYQICVGSGRITFSVYDAGKITRET